MAKNSVVEIAKEIVAKHGLSQKDAEFFVSAVFEQIYDGLSVEDVVKVKGLGTFKVIEVRDRESVNVNTGERVIIEGHNKISFAPDAVMRDFINKPFAQFETVVINDGVDIEELNDVQGIENTSGGEDVEILESSDINAEADDNDEKLLFEEVDESREPDSDVVIEGENMDKSDDVDNNSFQDNVVASVEEHTNILLDSQKESNEGPSCDEEQTMVEENEDKVTSSTTESDVNSKEKDNSIYDVCFFSRNKWFFVVLVMLVCAGSLLIGYYIGLSHRTEKNVKIPVKKKYNTVVLKSELKDSVDNDTITKEIKEDLNIISEEDVSEVRKVDLEEHETESKSIDDDASALNTAKNMVRTGAYRILGTDRTITIKEGETLKKISKFHLGEGMECYIQVHNGIVDIKEGQKLKIPKLELKKKIK